jgi:hypothetical protein
MHRPRRPPPGQTGAHALAGLGGGGVLAGSDRNEVFAAWRHFFETLAERRSLVLVFEDLHWADDGLLDFVDYLGRLAGSSRWVGRKITPRCSPTTT